MAATFRLYLVRHGQSANNALPESERVDDPALTGLGQLQAARLAERFAQQVAAGTKVDVLLTSAFRRALETMRPVAEALQVQPAIWTGLHEVGGCFRGYLDNDLEGCPGMTRTQLEDEFPQFVVPDDIGEDGWWKSAPFEEFEDAIVRAAEQGTRLVHEFLGQEITVVCVIHADFKSLLLREFLGATQARAGELWNTGVTLLEFQSDVPEVREINDISHLDDHQASR